ncbi:MAG: hypothetical protein RR802_05970 [Erysipelotrichaceae bacterium]
MFDLYDINGSKKLSNIGQCGQVYGDFPITTAIRDDNLIGAKIVVVAFEFTGSFKTNILSIGIASDLHMSGNVFTLYFNKEVGTLSIDTSVADKSLVKITGYSYIK